MFRLTFLLVLLVPALSYPNPEDVDDNQRNAIVKQRATADSTEDTVVQSKNPEVTPEVAAQIIEDLVQMVAYQPVTPSLLDVEVNPQKIIFLLYTRVNPGEATTITDANLDVVDPKKKTVFITHGWITMHVNRWIRDMRDAYLQVGDYNIIVVDWDAYAFLPYGKSVKAVPKVGKIIGEMVLKLNKKRQLPMDFVHLVGHSLRGQISGFAGQAVNAAKSQRIGRITGLDTAGPLFEKIIGSTPDDAHLTADDADFVDAIHSNGGGLGYAAEYGDADFYPNGGKRQKGCNLFQIPTNFDEVMEKIELIGCNHQRSIFYFIESITSDKFVAKKCNSYVMYEAGVCRFNRKGLMGEPALATNTGKYMLNTNGRAPYAQG